MDFLDRIWQVDLEGKQMIRCKKTSRGQGELHTEN